MDLYDETKALWRSGESALSARWAKEMRAGLPALEKASKLFRRPKPFRFHVTE